MAKWMTSGSSNVTMRFVPDADTTASGVDIVTKCVTHDIANSYTWSNRRNMFGFDDPCNTCDLR